jgi:hypothetical protein
MSLSEPSPRYDLTGLDVQVQPHVFDRALERLGVVLTHEEVRQQVFHLVLTGRWSREKPRWLEPDDPYRDSRYAIYAWPSSMRYAYVAFLGPNAGAIIVVTLLTPSVDPLETPLRRGLLRWLREHGDAGV